jgi:hypothetical protein
VPGKGTIITADLFYYIGDKSMKPTPYVKKWRGNGDTGYWNAYFHDTAVTDTIKFMFKYFAIEPQTPLIKRDVF